MYFSSPERTRLALGPGRAVLILGPARVLLVSIVVVIASSGKAVSRRSSVVSQRAVLPKKADSALKPHQLGGWKTSRYRTSWDAPAKATLPDDGAGTPESRASTRAGANWRSDGASGNIPSSL